MSGIKQRLTKFVYGGSTAKALLIFIVGLLIIYSVLVIIVLIDFHSSTAYDELIVYLNSDEIVSQCGNYVCSSPFITGKISYTAPNRTDGIAALKLNFTTTQGKYTIYAYLSGTDGVWTVTSYELVER